MERLPCQKTYRVTITCLSNGLAVIIDITTGSISGNGKSHSTDETTAV